MKTALKIIIISILFYLLVPVAFMSYNFGGTFDIVVFFVTAPVSFVIIWLFSNRFWMVPLFGVNYAASYYLHVTLSSFLFYKNISSDEMTLPVGFVIAFLGVIIILVVSVILTIIKAVVLRKEGRGS